MDIYDPQTLGIMVFGGFMVISAVGIALVSTFSMKETSYEEALAKQRRELGKIQSVRSEKKKKDKVAEKKTRGKKKEEKPNGKISDQEKSEEGADSEAEAAIEPGAAPAVAAVPATEPAPLVDVKPSAAPVVVESQPKPGAEPSLAAEPSPVPSPKEKKKKKVAKIEPASTQPAPTVVSAPAPVKSSAASSMTQAPLSAQTKAAPSPSAPASTKSATASAKSTSTSTKSAPNPSTKSAPPPATASASTKSSNTQAKSAAPAPNKSAPAPSRSVPATAKSTPVPSKATPVLETVTKDVPVMAVPPVGSQQAPAAPNKTQEPKKKASKKKSESAAAAVDSADAPLYLPYKALVSTISSMMFSEREAHRLIEILSEKVGTIQDTWHTATQKGDPVAMLKKQLEEREKQLVAEQEDASAAKNRLREITKELSAEKSKVASVETRLSSQLSKREQEMIALQARMQASYQDHVAQTQRLNAKILSLQDQLEKGPNAQLARLQQENSILRDALNKATSQAESKQNAELAKLRQECAKLTKELGEKTENLLADEHVRKGLESKLSAAEKKLTLLQASSAESEQALQKRLEEVCEELRTTQGKNNSLQATLEKTQQDSGALTEYQVRIERLEAEVKEWSAQVDTLNAQLQETQVEKNQLTQQVASINSLLEASQSKHDEDGKQQLNPAELEHLKLGLQEKDTQLSALQEELKQLQIKKEAAENTIAELEQKNKSEDASLVASLQEELKNLKEEMVQVKNSKSDSSAEITQLQNSLSEKDSLITSLQEELRGAKATTDHDAVAQLAALRRETKEALQSLFPQIPVETEQSNWLKSFTQEAQKTLSQQSQESISTTASPEILEKLKESEENYSSLQAECDQYRTVLAETEGMLKHLQKSVEEEELVWKSKMANSEEQLKEALQKVGKLEAENQSVEQLKEQIMLLEAQLEKQSDNPMTSEAVEQFPSAQLKLQLSDCQNQLDLAQKDVKAHKEELQQVQDELSRMTVKLHGEETLRQQLSEEFEQAQKTVGELQAQLDLLKASSDAPQSDTEDLAQLKERLEKEKKLSKDLGQAATKLQQLLKATQEQLTKERETVKTLQEHKGEIVELKEGTSV
ncbi:ribosome-binding protein 1a isoform X2 [Cyprinodon tularosa]|uniref:ribosome-binding protein 1a isoform X2 n=1 Tax=Cyprinodon tularosa TaxID=77115 RepID=UPI0018E28970|nr:ribosome-binding protein 1a isoform X2 [Cyprinodon tularosa]